MRNLTLLFNISMFSLSSLIYSQVAIGTSTIEKGIALQLEANDKGVLFPRVVLTSKNATSPLLTSIPTGTMVFNTKTTGTFPNLITPGLHWWSAEEKQWTNVNTNLVNPTLKYTNRESTINYNVEYWRNAELFGQKVFNESNSVYIVNSSAQTLTIGMAGLYAISPLLSFDRIKGSHSSRISLTARVYVNEKPVGTEQVINPGFTHSINKDRGLFSHSFTEYLELDKNDVISIKLMKTYGSYSGSAGKSEVQFKQSGDSSISILRIR